MTSKEISSRKNKEEEQAPESLIKEEDYNASEDQFY